MNHLFMQSVGRRGEAFFVFRFVPGEKETLLCVGFDLPASLSDEHYVNLFVG